MEVINGTKKPKSTKLYAYSRALERLISGIGEDEFPSNRDILKKYLNLSVNYIALLPDKVIENDLAPTLFSLCSGITSYLGMLTPNEFMQMFPIAKEYDGEKYQVKDYFSTMEAVNKLNPNKPIGEEKIMYFLWDYHNITVSLFEVNKMCIMSHIRRMQGEKGLMEEFLDSNGVDSYTVNMEKGYMVNNKTGKCSKISKRKKRVPPQIKVVE